MKRVIYRFAVELADFGSGSVSAVVLVEGALILVAAGPAVPGSRQLNNRTHNCQQIKPSNT